ncbi:hypothetical protein BP5796_08237 [Coleophoma crateriformis]|uniref:Zn(2)-C6 fungal-type domain-containing protein n=1 Tax=Coleophoma crateriformis TaxID=565419 RepID=A0A3D8RDR2_9HELO|nr:hypothetical protein BP5796_08237 [Coleophoma crateriformis]
MDNFEVPVSGNGRQRSAFAVPQNDNNTEAGRKRLRKQEGIKRACTECRQQKLRCDVVRDPFSTCSRCRRLRLACKIDTAFQRIEKRRSKSARQQVETRQPSSGVVALSASHNLSDPAIPDDLETAEPEERSRISGVLPSIAATEPEDISQPYDPTIVFPTYPIIPHDHNTRSHFEDRIDSSDNIPTATATRKLDAIELSPTEVQDLFSDYFENYHQFLPLLNPSKSPSYYYESSRLLFWTTIAIASRRYQADLTLLTALSVSVPRLLWSVLQSVPQNYHDVKALCLLCTWPFPLSSSSSDPTFMLSGTMIHVAMQMGLHRPSQAQDFSKIAMKVPLEELQDRATAWTVCKIVAQSVATGYGQPSTSFDNSILSLSLSNTGVINIPEELRTRLRIESLCHRISKSLYSISEVTDNINQQTTVINLLSDELFQVETDLSHTISPVQQIYLRCAQLHLRLYALFDSNASQNFTQGLVSLYRACESLLSLLLKTEKDILSHSPNYVFQMALAAGFALLKLITSPAAQLLEGTSAKAVFNSAIVIVRKMSVSNNDLPGRLADVLAQLKARGRSPDKSDQWQNFTLKVRSRMSMSVTFDALWHWRKGFEASGSSANTARAATTNNFTDDALNWAGGPSLVQEEFHLDDELFDEFYPLNWMVESPQDYSSIYVT